MSISIKTTHTTFSMMLPIVSFDPNNNKIDKKSYKNIVIYHIGYVTIKDLKYLKINSVNTLNLLFGKVNDCFEEINKNKYLTLGSTNENREM